MRKKIILLWVGLLFVFMYNVKAPADTGPSGDLSGGVLTSYGGEEAGVPVVMYHLVTENGRYVGRYGITPGELEHDIQYLRDNGYATVVMADLIAFVYQGEPLPEKCVMLTFDDGNFSDYQYLFPLLQKYDAKAVSSVVGQWTDNYTKEAEVQNGAGHFPNLTWPQVKEMAESGRVEFQSHSYNLHGSIGSGKRSGESVGEYQARLKKDLGRLQERCRAEINQLPTTFTYPLGVMSESSRGVLDELGFKASISCTEGLSVLKYGDPECLYRLKRVIRPSGRPIERVLAQIYDFKN